MAPDGVKLWLEPWSADFEGSIQTVEEQEPASVDTRVEGVRWGAIRPAYAPPPGRIAFVDGVRRIEHRLLVAQGGRTVFGLLGSLAAGATIVGETAAVEHTTVRRVIISGGGLRLDPFGVTLGTTRLSFESESEPDNLPETPLRGLQKAMRGAEARLTEELAENADLVIQDGPLSFVREKSCRVLGFVKRLQRTYLEGGEQALLVHLAPGERTPLFLVGGREARYSWYLRLARGRATLSPLAGVVRLEMSAQSGLEASRHLADLSAREIPRFASEAPRDPRAPQNLYPVGGLEARLKHLLGDASVIRRAIEVRLHSEVRP
jgi:hypothetical protein